MESSDNRNENEHVINITSICDASSSSSRVPVDQSPLFSTTVSNPINSSPIQRENSRARQRSPLNSVLWISFDVVSTVSQIIAAVVVLCLSNHEKPHAPLREWIVGYASGCVAFLPLLYWRYIDRNSDLEQDSSSVNHSADSLTSTVIEGEDRTTTVTASTGTQNVALVPCARLKVFIAYFRTGVDCFFAVWFVVGIVWICKGHSSSSEAPNLYWLCVVFLTFSGIAYAMFFIAGVLYCCFTRINSVQGSREDSTPNRGATQDSINSLPTYKFKTKKHKSGNGKENNSSASEGGVVAAGTEKEREISGQDAVCCICLGKYSSNNDLRELPCSHFFHKECVDKWLKINSLCPLCKADVRETTISPIEAIVTLR